MLDWLLLDDHNDQACGILRGEHFCRAIGKFSRKRGKIKFSKNNATKYRMVIADSKIHILG